ncbi:MAG TPA: prepilin-type N-terminal cleavage/methylation domain-containing protein [Candidatus Paceibacterota bacterium]|nr:prepilin-type N-terminal cleavage/methylation domain-containing protein [Candidatus Paceibacterota bacterium]
MKKRSENKGNKGFTLVEAMVAISILSLAVTGPLIIAQKGLGSAVYAKDQIIAAYLAQEAVEYVRNARDTNRITGAAWLNGLSACMVSGGSEACEIDARKTDFLATGAVQSCPGGACDKVSFDPSSGLYGYGIGSATKFTRSISIDNRASAKEATMTVTVSWATNLFLPVRTFTVRETIFNF